MLGPGSCIIFYHCYFISHFLDVVVKNMGWGTGVMSWWLRALATLAEDQGSASSTYMGQFLTICNSSSMEPSADSWNPWALLSSDAHIYTQEHKLKK